MGTIRDREMIAQMSSCTRKYIALICDADRHTKEAAVSAQWEEEWRKREEI